MTADPAPGPAGAPSDVYAAATHTLRSAARWLLAAAAGVGAALVAGLQLTSLGQLTADEWPRIVIALAGLAIGLAGVGYMVREAARLLTDEWINLAQLSLEQFEQHLTDGAEDAGRDRRQLLKDITDELEVYREELYGDVAENVEGLYQRLIAANRDSRTGAVQPRRPWQPPDRSVDDARRAAAAVVNYANYRKTRYEFERLRVRLAWGSIPVILGAVLYAYAANPPSDDAGAARPAPSEGEPAAPAPTR